jgi:xylulokinase
MELGHSLALSTTAVYLSGGGARSNFWQQMVADVLGVEVARVGVDEGPAYGAAILAAVGCNFYESVEQACKTLIHIKDVKAPRQRQLTDYQQLYSVYRPLYRELVDFYRRDADFLNYGTDAT